VREESVANRSPLIGSQRWIPVDVAWLEASDAERVPLGMSTGEVLVEDRARGVGRLRAVGA
jgi:hypothetical protein